MIYLLLVFLEQAKAHSRELRKTDRELVRDRHKLETEEQRIVKEKNFHMTEEDDVFELFRSTKYERMQQVAIKK